MEVLKTARPREGLALLTLNRPEARNALSMELRQALTAALERCREDAAVRCVVIEGAPQFFAAGADLREIADISPIGIMALEVERHWRAMAQFPKPLIAAVRGHALGGGCELAMHCDIIIAGRSARFGLPEVKLGLMPGGGGTQRLARAVGKFQAMRYLLTGDAISAETALALGLACDVVDDEEVLATALDLATRIAERPPLAVRQIKEAVLAGQDVSLDAALALERKSAHLLFASQDMREGIAAFLEKRPPVFTGR